MSDIHINRGGQNLGIFPQSEVEAGLNSGRFLGTDLAWRSGMENWKPLAQWSDFTIPANVPASSSSPVLPVSGELVTLGEQDLPSWEKRDSLGFLSAFGNTVKEVLLEPSATFSRMKETGGIMVPFIFMVISVALGTALSWVVQFALQSMTGPMLASQNPEIARLMAMQSIGIVGSIVILVVVLPIALFVGSFITSGLWHLALMILGGANKPFEATYRVYCYSSGATALLSLVPCCGAIAAVVWGIVAGAIGLSKVHQISTGKAVLAILLPLILCCSLCGVGIFALYQSLMNNPEFMSAISKGFNSQ